MNLYKKEENLPAKSLDTGTKPLQKSRAAYRRIFMSTKGGESFIWRKVSRAKLLCRKPMEILWRSNDCTIPRCYLCQQIRGLVLTSLNHRNTRVYTTCPSYNTRVPSQKSFMLYERMWLQETKLKHTRKEREKERLEDRVNRQRWGNAWIPSHVFAHTHSFVGDSGAQPRWENRPLIAGYGSIVSSFICVYWPSEWVMTIMRCGPPI